MSIFISVYGGIELDDEQLLQLKKIIAVNEDGNPYIGSWLFHENGGWFSYAFFGHTVNEQAIETVRSQVRRIAMIKSIDGEFTDFVAGRFTVAHENDEGPHYEWKVTNGEFIEQRIA